MAGGDYPVVGRVKPSATSYYPATHWWLWGGLALSVVFVLVAFPLLALLSQVDLTRLTEPLTNPYLQRVIRFSLWQAFWSTVLSVLLAIPLATALSRRGRFPGRALLLNLFSVSLVIPSVVAVFGIVAVYGRTGWFNQGLAFMGMEARWSIYGMTGILLGHVFFNLPLATRVFLQSLDALPDTYWRLSAQLGMSARDGFLLLEWPAIKSQLAGIVLLVFSLCFTSFAIVMTLGGGPRATTIEVAIYQALRFDFDLAAAVSLALVQLGICVLLVTVSHYYRVNTAVRLDTFSSRRRYGADSHWQRLCDALLILFALVFVVTPLLALVVAAVNPALPTVLTHARTLKAAFNTLWVALISGGLSVALALALLVSVRHLRVRLARESWSRVIESTGLLILVAPPIVLGTGLFILLRSRVDIFSAALVIVILVNALMSLPFVLRILSAPMENNARRFDRLSVSLGILGWSRWRLVEWPNLRRPLGLAMAVASTLSAGDLTVIALFGSERVATLPLLLFQRMGSYRLQEAAVTAFLLLLFCLLLFWTLERVIAGRQRAGPEPGADDA
ncbi:MAG: thiamine/thiamine pyrophosphate ABC transporter permease [Gammaproteobacteria bacterium]|nr:thiamine/thiamine pyrophosphate ABC transporter permease [Gammaproteobacteria bacterium]